MNFNYINLIGLWNHYEGRGNIFEIEINGRRSQGNLTPVFSKWSVFPRSWIVLEEEGGSVKWIRLVATDERLNFENLLRLLFFCPHVLVPGSFHHSMIHLPIIDKLFSVNISSPRSDPRSVSLTRNNRQNKIFSLLQDQLLRLLAKSDIIPRWVLTFPDASHMREFLLNHHLRYVEFIDGQNFDEACRARETVIGDNMNRWFQGETWFCKFGFKLENFKVHSHSSVLPNGPETIFSPYNKDCEYAAASARQVDAIEQATDLGKMSIYTTRPWDLYKFPTDSLILIPIRKVFSNEFINNISRTRFILINSNGTLALLVRSDSGRDDQNNDAQEGGDSGRNNRSRLFRGTKMGDQGVVVHPRAFRLLIPDGQLFAMDAEDIAIMQTKRRIKLYLKLDTEVSGEPPLRPLDISNSPEFIVEDLEDLRKSLATVNDLKRRFDVTEKQSNENKRRLDELEAGHFKPEWIMKVQSALQNGNGHSSGTQNVSVIEEMREPESSDSSASIIEHDSDGIDFLESDGLAPGVQSLSLIDSAPSFHNMSTPTSLPTASPQGQMPITFYTKNRKMVSTNTGSHSPGPKTPVRVKQRSLCSKPGKHRNIGPIPESLTESFRDVNVLDFLIADDPFPNAYAWFKNKPIMTFNKQHQLPKIVRDLATRPSLFDKAAVITHLSETLPQINGKGEFVPNNFQRYRVATSSSESHKRWAHMVNKNIESTLSLTIYVYKVLNGVPNRLDDRIEAFFLTITLWQRFRKMHTIEFYDELDQYLVENTDAKPGIQWKAWIAAFPKVSDSLYKTLTRAHKELTGQECEGINVRGLIQYMRECKTIFVGCELKPSTKIQTSNFDFSEPIEMNRPLPVDIPQTDCIELLDEDREFQVITPKTLKSPDDNQEKFWFGIQSIDEAKLSSQLIKDIKQGIGNPENFCPKNALISHDFDSQPREISKNAVLKVVNKQNRFDMNIKINDVTYSTVPQRKQDPVENNYKPLFVYTNLNNPIIQIPKLILSYPEAVAFMVCELNLNFDYIKKGIIGHPNFSMYFHQPIMDFEGNQRIYSLIMIDDTKVTECTSIVAPPPFTQVFVKTKKWAVNLCCVYRPHDSSYKNTLLKWSDKSKDLFTIFCEHLRPVLEEQKKVASIFVGDINIEMRNHAKRDKNRRQMIKTYFSDYTNHTRNRLTNFHARGNSSVDIFMTKDIDADFSMDPGRLVENDGHEILKLQFKSHLTMEAPVRMVLARSTLDEVQINILSNLLFPHLKMYLSEIESRDGIWFNNDIIITAETLRRDAEYGYRTSLDRSNLSRFISDIGNKLEALDAVFLTWTGDELLSLKETNSVETCLNFAALKQILNEKIRQNVSPIKQVLLQVGLMLSEFRETTVTKHDPPSTKLLEEISKAIEFNSLKSVGQMTRLFYRKR